MLGLLGEKLTQYRHTRSMGRCIVSYYSPEPFLAPFAASRLRVRVFLQIAFDSNFDVAIDSDSDSDSDIDIDAVS